jgi:hypothetical protein
MHADAYSSFQGIHTILEINPLNFCHKALRENVQKEQKEKENPGINKQKNR